MKIYMAKIETISEDWGRHVGWENYYYSNKEKAKAKIEEIKAMPNWWMVYGDMIIEEIEVE